MEEKKKLGLSKFVYTGYRCKKCSYEGEIEIRVPYFVKDIEPTFKVGDKVLEANVGITEHFDGFFCPSCLKNTNKPEIVGVRLIFEDGVFTRCIFD